MILQTCLPVRTGFSEREAARRPEGTWFAARVLEVPRGSGAPGMSRDAPGLNQFRPLQASCSRSPVQHPVVARATSFRADVPNRTTSSLNLLDQSLHILEDPYDVLPFDAGQASHLPGCDPIRIGRPRLRTGHGGQGGAENQQIHQRGKPAARFRS